MSEMERKNTTLAGRNLQSRPHLFGAADTLKLAKNPAEGATCLVRRKLNEARRLVKRVEVNLAKLNNFQIHLEFIPLLIGRNNGKTLDTSQRQTSAIPQ